MPKHNNALANVHLRKHWQKWVKTNFNQPMDKLKRLNRRKAKAEALFPRPIKTLRPSVRGCTRRYNRRVRAGRGFTLEELAQAGIAPAFARTVGISVDHRRTNRSTESKMLNVQRLKAYREKLVLLPKKAGKPKKGVRGVISDTPNAVAADQQTVEIGAVMPRAQDAIRQKAVTVTGAMKTFQAHRAIRQEWSNLKNVGKRNTKVVKEDD